MTEEEDYGNDGDGSSCIFLGLFLLLFDNLERFWLKTDLRLKREPHSGTQTPYTLISPYGLRSMDYGKQTCFPLIGLKTHSNLCQAVIMKKVLRVAWQLVC